MIRTVLVGCAAASLILGAVHPAASQDIRDRCRASVGKEVFNTFDLKRDTFYWLSWYSAIASGQGADERAPSPPFSFNGITAALSRADVERLLAPLLPAAQWQTIYQNRFAVLLMSGDEAVSKAWLDCFAKEGGGVAAYFQAVPDKSTLLELHVDYRPAASGAELPALKIGRAVAIDPKLGRLVEHKECLNRNYAYAPGQNCVATLEAPSAWSAGNITITLSDGTTSKDISVYLPPRPTLRGEQKPWPTEKMTADWAKAHPSDNPINVLSRYADEKTGPRAWDMDARREAEEGWFFIEGERTPGPDNAYTIKSEDIRVDAKPSGDATSQDCAGGYRLDAAAKALSIGIGLGVSRPGPGWCLVTVTATMARLLFDPPFTAAPPATARASVPAATDASSCEQRYRSYDPATGTYLGTDGNRRPCR
jgi:hypothetical protein